MAQMKQRRRNGKIDRLPPDLRDSVDQMLLAGVTYREIVSFLKDSKVELSRMAVCNYARKFLATAQMLHIAQENFKILTEELDKYPTIDATEAIIRVMGNSMLNTLANATPEDWQEVDLDKLMREANSLVRVTAHKKRVDVQNRNAQDKAFDEIKQLFFKSFAKSHPELYQQMRAALKEMQEKDS